MLMMVIASHVMVIILAEHHHFGHKCRLMVINVSVMRACLAHDCVLVPVVKDTAAIDDDCDTPCSGCRLKLVQESVALMLLLMLVVVLMVLRGRLHDSGAVCLSFQFEFNWLTASATSSSLLQIPTATPC